jgi:hypothetical protein
MTTDNLKCGNCGYDGGLAHAEEKLEWQDQLHKAQKQAMVDGDTRRVRAFVVGLTVTLSVIVISLAQCSITERELQAKAPPPPAPIPLTVEQQAQRTLTIMYDNCMRNAQGTASINACNDTFKLQIGNLKTTVGD